MRTIASMLCVSSVAMTSVTDSSRQLLQSTCPGPECKESLEQRVKAIVTSGIYDPDFLNFAAANMLSISAAGLSIIETILTDPSADPNLSPALIVSVINVFPGSIGITAVYEDYPSNFGAIDNTFQNVIQSGNTITVIGPVTTFDAGSLTSAIDGTATPTMRTESPTNQPTEPSISPSKNPSVSPTNPSQSPIFTRSASNSDSSDDSTSSSDVFPEALSNGNYIDIGNNKHNYGVTEVVIHLSGYSMVMLCFVVVIFLGCVRMLVYLSYRK